jgi:hypothetical protein
VFYAFLCDDCGKASVCSANPILRLHPADPRNPFLLAAISTSAGSSDQLKSSTGDWEVMEHERKHCSEASALK